ncbi:mycothione reductase [Nocardia spumae]|uniref:mycothione reductase n=1 Tax=Nocardia spumae TaxID=2887190 RepID=UPI001D14928C|nr:mycothione reductase [Nocardia spumae]
MRRFDVVVLGAGSGNMVIGDEFSGRDVAIVEERAFGGTCLNFGCIPSKMLVYPAQVVDSLAAAPALGVRAHGRGLDWEQVSTRVFDHTDKVAAAGRRDRIESDFVTVYEGHARFRGPRTIEISRADGRIEEITAEQIVIAVGGRPAVPAPVREAGVAYETSDTIMRIGRAPRHLAILGGGYVAAELAQVFAAAGSRITLIEQQHTLLGAAQDDDIRATYTALATERYALRLGAEVVEAAGRDGQLRLDLDSGDPVEADILLVAAGRTPNTDRLAVAAAGVEIDEHGGVIVDRFGRTSAEGIYALGDACDTVPLKHVANREARVVAHNLLHPDDPVSVDDVPVPSAVFTTPQIAAVGRTENQCRAAGLDYRVGVAHYRRIAYGWACRDDTGFCKVLTDADGQIVGAHILGPQAATLIQIFVVAMSFGIRAQQLAQRPLWVHPAPSEIVERALLDLHHPDRTC